MGERNGLRVMLASSRDVRDARDRVCAVVAALNDRFGGQRLDLWRWETHAVAGLRPEGPAGLINSDLDDADFIVLLVWNRVSPGTAAALRAALERWKRRPDGPTLLAYFSEAPSVLTTEEACLQRIEVLKTRGVLEAHGRLATYADLDDLADRVERDLHTAVRAVDVKAVESPSSAEPPDNDDVSLSDLLRLSRQLVSN